MSNQAVLKVNNTELNLPVFVGSEGEVSVDVRDLRAKSGVITFDEGYGNTGSCVSKVTFIDGEKGILRYRGYPIEQLAEQSTFVETAYLVIYGELPTAEQRKRFSALLSEHAAIHERMVYLFEHYPRDAHPMAILGAMSNALGCYYPHLATNDQKRDLENFDEAAATAISKVRTIAAMTYRMSRGLPIIYPKRSLLYCENFLHMMFSEPYDLFECPPVVARALNLILLLHADHEQNCSTSTVRMVASSGANLFASTAAGICALWGPLHGGANQAVIQMLQSIHDQGDDGTRFIENAKAGKSRLMGFGHRVYKNYDPRAKIIGRACEELLATLGTKDPLLDIARRLEQAALQDSYFLERKLYPNVDFYSGIMMRAIGIPMNMFTVMFAIGRMPGWVANWHEVASHTKGRIYRPRQVYTGPGIRDYVPVEQRG
ncbi:citrate synthase [Opitutales bacterium ASA1]|jgi:citrate synthase|uniref:citrate synthase n=1 Tax=Congregicoccus parvus TaxID=3081749 RepID=UPI002B2B0317|nr:citrate synthase [Opitutales bacterium ASA1]